MLAAADASSHLCRKAMATQQIHQALNAIWAVVAEANRYFAAAAPWELRKSDPARMATVLYVTAEVLRQVGILVQPVDAAVRRRSCSTFWRSTPATRQFAALGPAGRLAAGKGASAGRTASSRATSSQKTRRMRPR